MSEQRDTQFAGFAKLLFDETLFMDEDDMKRHMARRIHDIVQHTIGYSLEYMHECGVELAASGAWNSRIQPTIPDATKWPEWMDKIGIAKQSDISGTELHTW